MPDFICIGGQRTGTTWLHHVLSSNQTVWMPPCKELHHFDTLSPDVTAYPYRYREHLGSRLRHYGLAAARLVRRDLRPDVAVRLDWDWDLRYFLQPGRSIDWYRGLFQTRAAQGKVTGEITPAYSLLPQGEVQAIADALPKAKIILILREPLSRAWSHALKDLPAEAANDTDRMVSFLRDPECFERSNWPEIIGRWQSAFPADQMLVLDFDQIKAAPDAFLAKVATFLGTDLALPESREVGGSLRERGSSSYRAGGIPAEVKEAVADLYAPVIQTTAEMLPDIAGGWLDRKSELLDRATTSA